MTDFNQLVDHVMALADAHARSVPSAVDTTERAALQAAVAQLAQRAQRAELQIAAHRAVSSAAATAPVTPDLDQLEHWVSELVDAGIACGDMHDYGSAAHEDCFARLATSCRRLLNGVGTTVAQRDALYAALAQGQIAASKTKPRVDRPATTTTAAADRRPSVMDSCMGLLSSMTWRPSAHSKLA